MGEKKGVWSKKKIISKCGRKRDGRRGVEFKGGTGEGWKRGKGESVRWSEYLRLLII